MRSDVPVLAAGTAQHEIYLVYARLRNALRTAGANSAIRYQRAFDQWKSTPNSTPAEIHATARRVTRRFLVYREIGFEAIWSRNSAQSPHLLEFAKHLRKVVPAIVRGLQPIAKR